MAVRNTLQETLTDDSAAAEEARRWLARAEVFLEWVAKHPHLHQVNCEAAGLLSAYRGQNEPLIDVDYRGLPSRKAVPGDS